MSESQPAGIEPVSFFRRLVTGACFGAIFFGALVAGNKFFVLPILCAIFALIGANEFYNLTAPSMNKFVRIIGLILAIALPVITVFARLFIPENPVIGTGGLAGLLALFFVVALSLVIYLGWVAFTPTSKARDAALSFFGALYTGIPLSFVVLIREMERGIYLAPMIVVSVWAADSFAYLGGSLFGRHKLAPVVSPKKSWEGFIAGTLGSIVVWGILPFFTHNPYSFWVAIFVGSIISVASLVGDLFESRLKREAGAKDSGTLLPGHGGLLDRLDSTLLVSLVMFLLLSTVGVLLGVVTM